MKLASHNPTEAAFLKAFIAAKAKYPAKSLISFEEVTECYKLLVEPPEHLVTPAADLSSNQVIAMLDLKYDEARGFSGDTTHVWNVDSLEEYQLTPPLRKKTIYARCSSFTIAPVSVLTGYLKNFDRNCENFCNTVSGLILNDCLMFLKGMKEDDWSPSKRPAPYGNIKIHAEVSFKQIVSVTDPTMPRLLTGLVDYAIGLTSLENMTTRFWSLILLVKVKSGQPFSRAFDQLLAYLGALHQSRIRGNHSDASVYGCATDGTDYQFIMITHEGIVKRTKRLDILSWELGKILAVFTSILKTTYATSPSIMLHQPLGVPYALKLGNEDPHAVWYDEAIELDAPSPPETCSDDDD